MCMYKPVHYTNNVAHDNNNLHTGNGTCMHVMIWGHSQLVWWQSVLRKELGLLLHSDHWSIINDYLPGLTLDEWCFGVSGVLNWIIKNRVFCTYNNICIMRSHTIKGIDVRLLIISHGKYCTFSRKLLIFSRKSRMFYRKWCTYSGNRLVQLSSLFTFLCNSMKKYKPFTDVHCTLVW